MDYLLVCKKKKLYLRLGDGGSPIVCGKREAKVFEEKKAKNILEHLPKLLQKMNFVMEPIIQEENEPEPSIEEDIVEELVKDPVKELKEKKDSVEKEVKIIKNPTYSVPTNVKYWVERVEQCNRLIPDAKERRKELIECLSNEDKASSNILHRIELEKDMNACMGFKMYQDLKEHLRKRRVVKDEISMLDIIIEKNAGEHRVPSSQRMNSAVQRLENRVFRMRDMEDIEWLDKIYEGE